MSNKKDEVTHSRQRTENEMRQALEVLSTGVVKAIAPNYDTPLSILNDAIDEVLQLRQLRYDVLDFIQKEHNLIMRH